MVAEYSSIRLLHRLTGHEGAVYALCNGPEAGTFLSAGGEGWVVRWDLSNPDPGRLIARVEGQVFAVTMLREDQVILAGDMNGGVHWIDLLDAERSRHIQHHRKGTFSFAVYDGMVFSGGGDGLVTRWSSNLRQSEESLQISGSSIRSLAFDPSGEVLAAGCSDGSICLIDPLRMALRKRIADAHLPSVFSLQFNGAGDQLWSGGRDAHLRRWDRLGRPLETPSMAAHWYTINALALSPDAQWMATASRDKTIRIWDATTGELRQTLETVRDQGHRHSVNALFWSGEYNQLVSASDDRTVCIWTGSQGM